MGSNMLLGQRAGDARSIGTGSNFGTRVQMQRAATLRWLITRIGLVLVATLLFGMRVIYA